MIGGIKVALRYRTARRGLQYVKCIPPPPLAIADGPIRNSYYAMLPPRAHRIPASTCPGVPVALRRVVLHVTLKS